MDFGGYVFSAIGIVIVCYLIPLIARRRQILVGSHADDRFSDGLRVLACADSEPTRPNTNTSRSTMALLGNRQVTEKATGTQMNSHAIALAGQMPGRLRLNPAEVREVAALKNQLAARVATQKRIGLYGQIVSAVLFSLAALGWTFVMVFQFSKLLAGLATFLFVLAVAGTIKIASMYRAANKRDQDRLRRVLSGQLRAQRTRVKTAQVTRFSADGRFAQTKANKDESAVCSESGDNKLGNYPQADAENLVIAQPSAQMQAEESVVLLEAEAEAEAETVGAQPVNKTRPMQQAQDRAWTPQELPAPSYALKETAPRLEISPYEMPEPETAPVPMRPKMPQAPAPIGKDPTPYGSYGSAKAESIDLEEVLARRRVSA